MCRFLLVILAFSLSSFHLMAQRNGKNAAWHDNFSYHSADKVVKIGDKIYCSCKNAVFYYDINADSVVKISKVNTLSDVAVSTMEGNPIDGVVVVGYNNGNIDVISGDTLLRNVPDFKVSLINANKAINDIDFFDGKAFLSTGVGIIVLDYKNGYFTDKYTLGGSGEFLAVNSLAYNPATSQIFACTSMGVYKTVYGVENISDFSKWRLVSQLGDKAFSKACVFDNNLFVLQAVSSNKAKDTIFVCRGDSVAVFSDHYNYVKNIRNSSGMLVVSTFFTVDVFRPDGTLYKSIPYVSTLFEAYYTDAILDQAGDAWMATLSQGLMKSSDMEVIKPNSPISDIVSSIDYSNNVLFTSCGTPYAYSMSKINHYYFDYMEWFGSVDWNSFDVIKIVADKNKPDHYFAATYGFGLFEATSWYNITERYNKNSFFSDTAISPYAYVTAMSYDSKGNLFFYSSNSINNSRTDGAIYCLTSENRWMKLQSSALSFSSLTSMFIDNNNYVWCTINQDNPGLLVIDNKNTIADISDDDIVLFELKDAFGETFGNEATCVVVDNTDVMWVGTGVGLAYYPNASSVFSDSNPTLNRNKVKYDGVVDYLLSSEVVNAIDVDAANRKWVGTNSGVFVVNSDGSDIVRHFNVENSPLPSNSITAIKVVSAHNTVYIGTRNGLIAYDLDVRLPSEALSEASAFPNPITAAFRGVVTFDGLMDNTAIVITDVSGNLVYKTVSQGGNASWDVKSPRGKRVSPGVYLATCLNPDKTEKKVLKLVVED